MLLSLNRQENQFKSRSYLHDDGCHSRKKEGYREECNRVIFCSGQKNISTIVEKLLRFLSFGCIIWSMERQLSVSFVPDDVVGAGNDADRKSMAFAAFHPNA